MDRWERIDGESSEWADKPSRSRRSTESSDVGPRRSPIEPKPLPDNLASEIRKAAGDATAHHREMLVVKMQDAVAAYERGRNQEAARLAKQVGDEAPAVPAVRELAGLAAYRAGLWRNAIRHLTAYMDLTDDPDHIPTLMDCQRALSHPRRVSELWTELRQRSPGADIVAEGRMVAAGMLADKGDLDGAISMLATAGAGKALRNPSDRHLRQWYALADLYERAGDTPRAREFFSRVARSDPDAYDVRERLAGLGADKPRRNRKRATVSTSKKNPAPAPRTSKLASSGD